MKIGKWLFRWRGCIFIPLALFILLFARPTYASYVAGLAIALLGEALRMWGVCYSGATTRKSEVTAPYLVTAGPYAHVRNPLYLGNTITALGFAIAAGGGATWEWRILFLALVIFLYSAVYGKIILFEEEYLRQSFGEAYDLYAREVPRIIPRLRPYEFRQGRFDGSIILKAEVHTIILFLIFAGLLALKMAG